MAKTTIDTWNPEFLGLSPIFESVANVSSNFTGLKEWPTLDQFSAVFKARNVQSYKKLPIKSVKQGEAPEKFDDHYESRIYLKGELQTRLGNWHDYFNAMSWLQFPNIKSSLNALHYKNSKIRETGTNRNPLENAIALFDECGAVIVSSDTVMLDLIRNHKWKELFWDNKDAFGSSIQCYVFGHAMHEKSLIPYLGMTAHCLMLEEASDFFEKDYQEQLNDIDHVISDLWIKGSIENTKDLQPFPLLGVPGWWGEGQDESFYLNKEYFREKSRTE